MKLIARIRDPTILKQKKMKGGDFMKNATISLLISLPIIATIAIEPLMWCWFPWVSC